MVRMLPPKMAAKKKALAREQEMVSLVHSGTGGNTTSSGSGSIVSSGPSSSMSILADFYNRHQRLILVLLAGCMLLLVWTSIEVDAETGDVKLKLLSGRNSTAKELIHGETSLPIQHKPPSLPPKKEEAPVQEGEALQEGEGEGEVPPNSGESPNDQPSEPASYPESDSSFWEDGLNLAAEDWDEAEKLAKKKDFEQKWNNMIDDDFAPAWTDPTDADNTEHQPDQVQEVQPQEQPPPDTAAPADGAPVPDPNAPPADAIPVPDPNAPPADSIPPPDPNAPLPDAIPAPGAENIPPIDQAKLDALNACQTPCEATTNRWAEPTSFFDGQDLSDAKVMYARFQQHRQIWIDTKMKADYGEQYYYNIFEPLVDATNNATIRENIGAAHAFKQPNALPLPGNNIKGDGPGWYRMMRKMQIKLIQTQLNILDHQPMAYLECYEQCRLTMATQQKNLRVSSRAGDDTSPTRDGLFSKFVWVNAGHSASAGHGNLYRYVFFLLGLHATKIMDLWSTKAHLLFIYYGIQ